MDEFLKTDCILEVYKDFLLFLRGKNSAVLCAFHPFAEPFYFLRAPDEHVFRTDGSAIGLPAVIHDAAQGGGTDTDLFPGMEHRVQVFPGEAVVFQVEGGKIFAAYPDRVGLGEQVSPFPVGLDQVDYLEFLIEGFRAEIFRIIVPRELESQEELAPAFFDRAGVFQVFPVNGFDGFDIDIPEEREFILFHCLAHLQYTSAKVEKVMRLTF